METSVHNVSMKSALPEKRLNSQSATYQHFLTVFRMQEYNFQCRETTSEQKIFNFLMGTNTPNSVIPQEQKRSFR